MADGAARLDYVAELAAEGAGFISAVRHGPLDAPVATCPGWTVADLAGHLGAVHRWAAEVLSERLDHPPKARATPPAPEELPRWLDDGLVALIEAVRSTPLDTPVWGFGAHPRTAAFWGRRQAIETLVHRFDAELATDTLGKVEPALAADGVAEFIEVVLPRMWRSRPAPATPIELVATDTGERWRLQAPPSPDAAQESAAEPVAQVTGRASDLLLFLWQRRDLSLRVTGDEAAVAAWRELGTP